MIFDTAEYNMIGRNWNALTLHQHEPFGCDLISAWYTRVLCTQIFSDVVQMKLNVSVLSFPSNLSRSTLSSTNRSSYISIDMHFNFMSILAELYLI